MRFFCKTRWTKGNATRRPLRFFISIARATFLGQEQCAKNTPIVYGRQPRFNHYQLCNAILDNAWHLIVLTSGCFCCIYIKKTPLPTMYGIYKPSVTRLLKLLLFGCFAKAYRKVLLFFRVPSYKVNFSCKCGCCKAWRLNKNKQSRRKMQRLCLWDCSLQLVFVSCGFAIFVVALLLGVTYHTTAGNAQPNNHKHARHSDQNVQQSFQPNHAERNPIYDVETENTYRQPVDCADYRQN